MRIKSLKPLKKRRQRLRVAVTGLRGIPASWGGVERQCEELYTRIAQGTDLDVTVYARTSYVEEPVSPYKGVSVVRLPTVNTTHFEAIAHTVLSVLHMAFRQPDVVHVYSQGPCLALPLVRVLCPGAKVMFTCGGLDWQRKKWKFPAGQIIHLGEYFSARLTHKRIMVSKELCKYYLQSYGVDSEYIPNGVPQPKKLPLDKMRKFGIEPKKYFISVGRLVPEKRVEDLIQAFCAKPRDFKLVIAGGTAGREDYLEELYKLAEGHEGVIFTGYCFGDDLDELYANAKAYVSASELEGLPLTLLEGLSYELLCIVSDIPPHKEIVEQVGGELFSTWNVGELSEKMDSIESLPEHEATALGKEHAQKVWKYYNWDDAANSLAKLYYGAKPQMHSLENKGE